jgi:hypothetical protein
LEKLLEEAIVVVESIVSLIGWYSLISGNIICDGIIKPVFSSRSFARATASAGESCCEGEVGGTRGGGGGRDEVSEEVEEVGFYKRIQGV